MILIQASTDEEAWRKAEIAAKASVGDDQNSYTCDNRPAKRMYRGIRKLIQYIDESLEDGIEISHSQYEADSSEDVNKLAQGDEVRVTYID